MSTENITNSINLLIQEIKNLIQTATINFVTAYANIYVADGTTAQSIPTGATYTKLTGFAENGDYENATPDHTADKITLTKKGKYFVTCPINASTGTSNVTFKIALFLNGVEQDQVHSHRKFASAGDNGSASMAGIIDVTEEDLDIDVRARHNNGGAVNLTLTYASLSVIYIGQT